MLIFLATLSVVPTAWGAACCGGGFAVPSLVMGEDRAQVTLGLASQQLTTDVADGWWRDRRESETLRTYRLDAAFLWSDRWQGGFSLPLIERRVGEQSSQGWGDLALTSGYEYLPDWDYHPWRPRGMGFLQITLPTGNSLLESTDPLGLDSRGRGWATFGVGTLLTKNFSSWDVFTSFEVHRSFERQVHSSTQGHFTQMPGNGFLLGAGLGYNTAKFRWGAALSHLDEDPVRVEGDRQSPGARQRMTVASVSFSALAGEAWALTVTGSDSALLGNPDHATLGQGLALQLQRRWPR